MYRTAGVGSEGGATLTPEQEKAEALKAVQTKIDDANKALKLEISKEQKDALDSELKTLKADYEALKEQVREVKDSNGGSSEKAETILDTVKSNRENIDKSIKNKGSEHEFVVKASTINASVVGNQHALEVPGIGQLAHRKLTVYDMFAKIPVGVNMNGVVRYVDWDDATKVRAAAAILEEGIFPESTAKWATYTLALKKVGDTIPMSEEFAYDNQMFAAELENFLRVNVAIKIDTDLISGNGVGANILGLLAQVPAYVPVSSGITDASIYDLIVKVKESISALYGSKYAPNVALMNISDINKYKLKKDANNNYVMPPFVTADGNTIDGILVLECNSVTSNQAIIGDSRYGKIYEEPGFYVATAYNGTDFAEDMVTMKARKRLNLLVRTVDQTGWKKVTSISAALTTLATVPI